MLRELRRDYLWHFLFWSGYLLIKVGIVEFFRTDQQALLMAELVSLPLKIVATYGLIYWLIPQYLLRKKYLHFIVLLVLSILIVAFMRRITDIFLVYPIIMLYPDEAEFWSLAIFRNLIFIYPVVGLGSAIYFVVQWVRTYQSAQEIERQKLEAELKILKSQVNPHFLFNTINNIYSLALEQSEKTAGLLLKLSDMLRIMLYDISEKKILLEKEIRLIEDYLELEKLRYGNKVDIFFKVNGMTDNYYVSPLMLIPLIENAFKHGVSKSLDACWVSIDLSVDEKVLKLAVENSRVESPLNKPDEGGMGLNNLRKRLDLEYPGRHYLEVQDSEDNFQVKLELIND